MTRVSTIKLYKGEGNMHSRNVLNAIRAQLAIVKNNDHPTGDQLKALANARDIGLKFIATAGHADINTVHRIAKLLRGDIKP